MTTNLSSAQKAALHVIARTNSYAFSNRRTIDSLVKRGLVRVERGKLFLTETGEKARR